MTTPVFRKLVTPGAAGLLAALIAFDAPMAQESETAYTPVTDERLRAGDPSDWLMYRRTYESWGYSPLDRITTENVADLVPVWSMSTGVISGHESPPIVNDGVMFVTTPEDRVIAVDARTGEQLWIHARRLPEEMEHPHRTNRGVGLYGDKVFFTTHDAFVVALDAVSGEVVWETAVADYRTGYYMTMAPLVASGKVMVGASGGERGIRGFVAALDPETGEEVWRSHTIPGPGEPGNETWPGETWRTGGASIWITGSYAGSQNWGPILATGGGLIFAGGTNDRYFRAFDAETGAVLWEQRTNSGVIGVPSSYAIDGVQYVAVQSGWGVDAQSMQRAVNAHFDVERLVPQGGVIWVFALPDRR